MKHKNFLKIIFALFLITNVSYGQLVTTIDFETENAGYTPSSTEGSTFTDVFNRIDRTGNPLGGNSTFLFAIEDLNTVSDPSIDLDQIDVSSSASFTFSIDMLAHHFDDWDNSDELLITYSLDGGAYQNLMWVQNTGDSFNAPAALDLAFDGDGDCGSGTTLPSLTTGTSDGCTVSSSDFATFVTNSITLNSNSTLDIKLQFNGFTAGDEGMYFDNIVITETSGSSNPAVSFDSASSTETETDVTFTTSGIPITLTNYDADVTITATVNGSSTAESGDYTLDVNPLTFDANETLVLPLSINDDADFDDETIIIDFTVTSGTADLGTSTHTVTITDDENSPSISFDATTSSETETDATFTSANMPITVSDYSGEQIDVNVAITGGTAEVGDYTYTTQSLSFTSNETKNITVEINDDADTDNETIIFTITETSSVTGLVISQATHTLTIVDNEAPASYSGVGTFVKITDASEIVDNGFYILLDETSESFAMNNTHNGTFLAKTDVTPSSNTLVNPATSIVWEIRTNGGGKSIFNSVSSKFVSYTGSSNNIQIEDNVTTDNQRWTITYETDEFHITNLAVTNRRLQYNSGSPRFAAYTGSQRDISIYKLASTTWTGNTNTNWATAGNWSNGIPTGSTQVIIPDVTDAPIIGASTNASAFNLTITETDGLTISSGGTLIVNGTSTGNVTHLMTLTNDMVLDNSWHLVSSPVKDEVFDSSFADKNDIAANDSNRGIASYNPGNTGAAAWTYFTGSNVNATSGIGFSMKITPESATAGEFTNNIVGFEGTINTESVETPSLLVGFNLLGNPYTSYVNSATFLGAATSSNIDQTQIWLWNQATGMYEVKTSGMAWVLAPGQGFFVNTTSTGTVTFDESNQTSSGNAFQKSLKTEVKLLLSDGENSRFATLNFNDNFTKGYDYGWEGETFGGIPNSLSVFTSLLSDNVGKKYQVQSLPNSDYERMIIPIGITADANKEITFTVDALNLPSGIKVFLEDRLTNTFTRLDEANSEYKITSDVTLDGIGRFYLHTKSSALNIENVDLDNVSIYKTDNSNLRIVGLSEGKSSIKLYNIIGKQVLNSSFTTNGVQNITLPSLAKGIYIVQLETETGKLNKKITLE